MTKTMIHIALFGHLLLFGAVDRIQKALDKKEYEKAHELIVKGYEKEPNNPGISYYHALLTFDTAYSKYHLDTARLAIRRAIFYLENASPELKEELDEAGISRASMETLAADIQNQTYRITLNDLSIKTIDGFIELYPQSQFNDLLTYKKDSIEFKAVIQNPSERAYVDFIRTHPISSFKQTADSLLDQMRYVQLKSSGSLNDYYTYLNRYPSTRYRAPIESYILKVATIAHRPKNYLDFIAFAKTPELKKRAGDYLYYRNKKRPFEEHPLLDSLELAHGLAETQLFPVASDTNIGFNDQQGTVRVLPRYNQIPALYKCSATSDDWIFTGPENGEMITKGGKILLEGIEDYRNLSVDIAMVQKDNGWLLYHKSGYNIINQPIVDAEVMPNNWIKVSRNGKWGLYSPMGHIIAEITYDDIYTMGNFWVFEKGDALAVYTKNRILGEVEDKGLSLEFKFDDIELVNANALIGFREERECLLDSSLNFLVPWGNYEIYPDDAGLYLKSDAGYQLYNRASANLMNRSYSYLESNDGWLALKTETDWMLIPRNSDLQPSRAYDSLKLISPYVVLRSLENQFDLLFSSGMRIPIEDELVSTIQQRPKYIFVKGNKETTLYNQHGETVLTGKFENIAFLNDSLVRVQTGNKQGLLHTSGEWILNPVFDNINEKDGLILTLIGSKIGCYDPVKEALMETEYSASVSRMGDYYLAKKGNAYGVVDIQKKEIISFNYDAIRIWNDTSYLVTKGLQNWIVNKNEEELYAPVESIRPMINNDEHAIYKFIKDGRYGLLSTKYGELLSPEFTDILNIGNDTQPLFFSDQHLDKAGFHVVSYVNQYGKLVLAKAYTREVFDRILCDD